MEFYLSLISSVLGIISFFLATKKEAGKVKTILVVTSLLIVILTGLTSYALRENSRLRSPQNKIQAFLNQWDKADPKFLSNGQLKGAMVEGMIVLESLKAEIPDNYVKATELVYNGHDPRVDKDFLDERSKLEDGYDAIISIMRGLVISTK